MFASYRSSKEPNQIEEEQKEEKGASFTILQPVAELRRDQRGENERQHVWYLCIPFYAR